MLFVWQPTSNCLCVNSVYLSCLCLKWQTGECCCISCIFIVCDDSLHCLMSWIISTTSSTLVSDHGDKHIRVWTVSLTVVDTLHVPAVFVISLSVPMFYCFAITSALKYLCRCDVLQYAEYRSLYLCVVICICNMCRSGGFRCCQRERWNIVSTAVGVQSWPFGALWLCVM